MSTCAPERISPPSTTRPSLIRVSQATRDSASCSSIASSTASEIWSAILSGWPSDTDSEVKTLNSDIDPPRQWGAHCSAPTGRRPGVPRCVMGASKRRVRAPKNEILRCACGILERPPCPSSRTDRANAVRALAMDAVEKAKSGHPGAPMGLADIAEVLWREVLLPQPVQSRLVEPGPAGHVERSRLDAAVRRAAPDRLRRQPRRPPRLPAVALEDGGTSGVRNLPGHRDDDGSAWPGPRERGRHGAGGVAARAGVQHARASPWWTTAPGCSRATAA